MKPKTLRRTSVFPAAKAEVFRLLKRPETLRYVAAPYAAFTPEDGGGPPVWEENAVCAFRLKLFGCIPCGTHTISVLSFSEDGGIYTQERNPHVPLWNHRITLAPLGEGHTRYTDEVEIEAGWKTPLVYWWARAFYAHRQRKWQTLLRAGKP